MCMVFMALITIMVLCIMSQDSSVSVRRVRAAFSTDWWAEQHRIIGHVKLSRSGEASRGPRALCGRRGQSIGAQVDGSSCWYLSALLQFQFLYSWTFAWGRLPYCNLLDRAIFIMGLIAASVLSAKLRYIHVCANAFGSFHFIIRSNVYFFQLRVHNRGGNPVHKTCEIAWSNCQAINFSSKQYSKLLLRRDNF